MKNVRKASAILALSLLMGCGTSQPATGSADGYKIGVIQFVKHAALDRATEGFKDAIAKSGLQVVYNDQNANGESSNCETIANILVNDGSDLIFANATPAAQAVAGKTTEIPIVITSVTDPASSGLVASNKNTGNNVTGTSDLTPVEAQINLLKQLVPSAKTIGIMYTGSEDNSIFQAELAKEAATKAGLETLEFTVSDSSTVQSTTESTIGKIDALYIPTDNLLAETMATVAQVTNANQIPVIVGEVGMVENGGLATYGIDYYNLGYLSGEMAVKVLNGESPSSMPIEYLPDESCELTINLTTAKELGLEIPEDILASAKTTE
ncbi:MAG: ABC transporter substrate-binding protein [Solobacterium sp.]|nr:ABC transporter substrate-binding protein [Solobacterium sp.]